MSSVEACYVFILLVFFLEYFYVNYKMSPEPLSTTWRKCIFGLSLPLMLLKGRRSIVYMHTHTTMIYLKGAPQVESSGRAVTVHIATAIDYNHNATVCVHCCLYTVYLETVQKKSLKND